jgi:hypothetical protein
MRFRAKFGAIGWCSVALGSLWLFVAFSRHSRSAHAVDWYTAAVVALPVFQQILNHLFTYWEVDSRSFRMRCLWTTKEVAWEEVKRERGAQDWPSSNTLELDYFRSAPMSDRGLIRMNPDHRGEFLQELRRFASQAEFEA